MHDVTVRHIGVPRQWSVFTRRPSGLIGVPKQLNGGHVTVPNQSVPVELFSYVNPVLILL